MIYNIRPIVKELADFQKLSDVRAVHTVSLYMEATRHYNVIALPLVVAARYKTHCICLES
jgi:hypothetical protein